MNDHSAATASFLATVVLVYGAILLALMIFTIWVYWRIFEKAGYNGAMSLLNLVPGVGPLIAILILAFGRWPIEDELALLRSRSAATMPPPSAPGTSVIPTV